MHRQQHPDDRTRSTPLSPTNYSDIDPNPNRHRPLPAERIATALEVIARAVVDARRCMTETRANFRSYLPWMLLWLFMAITNVDEGTRKALKSAWGLLTP